MSKEVKRYPYPVQMDTTGFKLRWNDTEVTPEEYAKLEQEAAEYNELLAQQKAELEAPAKRKKKSSTK